MKEVYFKGTKIFEFQDENVMQIMGENRYLIRLIVEIFYRILNGYKFSDTDIEAMNGYYPEVIENGETLKKNDILVIKISEWKDILEQMTTKKNSILMNYILSLSGDLEINKATEEIEKSLIELSLSIDNIIKNNLLTTELFVETSTKNINFKKLINSFINIDYVNKIEERIPLWLFNECEAVNLFIKITDLALENGKESRMIIDMLDSKLEIKQYNYLIKKLIDLTEKHSNFGVWIIPSSEKGVLVDYSIFNSTYIVNDDMIKLGDFHITYESICRNYPDNKAPTEKEVLKALLTLFPFHRPEKSYQLTRETVIMFVFLDLLGKERGVVVNKDHLTQLEYNFLINTDK